MRLSLLTLLLLVLWLATAMLVWERRVPWNLAPTVHTTEEGRALQAKAIELCKLADRSLFEAPDGLRDFDAHDGAAYVLDRTIDDRFGKRLIFAFIDWYDWVDQDSGIPMEGALKEIPGFPRGFLSDDAFAFEEYNFEYGDPRNRWLIFHRRHPEWWWGHFYRPEVWALLALTLAISWRCVKALRNRKLLTSASPTAYPQTPETPPSPPESSRASPAG